MAKPNIVLHDVEEFLDEGIVNCDIFENVSQQIETE